MGKITIAPLIYNGMHEWYVRFQLLPKQGVSSVLNYDATYLCKKEYTLEQAIEWRDNRLKYLEEKGLRSAKANRRTLTYKKITTKLK